MKSNTLLLLSSLFTVVSAYGTDSAPEADRKAILAMAGKYKVHFHFQETFAFQPGYELTKPVDEDAHEWVVVAVDTPRRIELQHLLVVGSATVVHHWRQVWTYEDMRVNEFQGNNTWKTRVLSPEEAKGTWTQLVTQVDNSPRYESWGRWSHDGADRWTSADTYRPLPRREYSKRKDYEVVAGTNSHILTVNGWAHEQANTKLHLTSDGNKPIARENGLNTYVHDDKFDFSPAEKYWASHQEFSNLVASEWEEVIARENGYKLDDDIENSGLRDEIKDLERAKLPVAETKEKVREAIGKFLKKSAVATK